MGRVEKLKRDHIKKLNKQLEENVKQGQIERDTIKLNPSANVTGNSSEFIKKMNKIF